MNSRNDAIQATMRQRGLTSWDLRDEYQEALSGILGAPVSADKQDGAPLAYAVFDPEHGDIIGAGDSELEALDEALTTVRAWEHAGTL